MTWTCSRIRATWTSISPWRPGPADRSWSLRPDPAAWPSRWPKPATRSPPSTSMPRCWPASAQVGRRGPGRAGNPRPRAGRRGGPGRAWSCPAGSASGWPSWPSIRSCCWTRENASGPPSRRWPATSSPAGWPSSMSGCPARTSWPGTTAGWASSTFAAIRNRAQVVTKTASAEHEPTRGRVELTAIYDEGSRASRPALDPRGSPATAERRRTARPWPKPPASRSRCWRATYELDPIVTHDERAILVARRRGRTAPAALI